MSGIYAVLFTCVLVFSTTSLSLSARDSKDAETKETISALELSAELSTFYANFTGIIEVTLGRASENTTDTAVLRTLTLAKLRLARACRAAVFQVDPRNALVDTWSLCVQFRIYATSDAPVKELGFPNESIPALRDAAVRLERDIALIANQYIPPARIPDVANTIEQFCKAHPLTSVHAVTPAPPIEPSAKSSNLDISKLLSLPLAPFHALQGVDHTAQAVAEFARVVNSIDHTVSNLPMETAWETEILLLDLNRDLSTLLDEKVTQAGTVLNGALASSGAVLNTILAAALEKTNTALNAAINLATLRLLEVSAAVFFLCLLYHFITRRWFPRKNSNT